jgi:hypothetical protein
VPLFTTALYIYGGVLRSGERGAPMIHLACMKQPLPPAPGPVAHHTSYIG